jgi:hypothetical protein
MLTGFAGRWVGAGRSGMRLSVRAEQDMEEQILSSSLSQIDLLMTMSC